MRVELEDISEKERRASLTANNVGLAEFYSKRAHIRALLGYYMADGRRPRWHRTG